MTDHQLFNSGCARNKFSLRSDDFTEHGPIVKKFWESHASQFPILSSLALRLIHTSSSSSKIERSFSQISCILTKQRNRLKARNLLYFM